MAGRAAQLAIDVSEQGASEAASGLDRVGAAAQGMGDKVEAAGKSAEKGASGLDTAAGGADELASKGSQAAGAMGGLGSLIGGPFGAAMQAGGVGLQAMADSGDLLNAALENSIVANVRAKAATVANTVATKAQAVATRVTTVAQKALNLAQRASPIGLIITGVILLVGLLALAYKRSASFRAIVDKAMSVARAGVDKVVGGFKVLGSVVGKVMQVIWKVVTTYVGLYVKVFQVSLVVVRKVWDLIRSAVANVVDAIRDKVTDLRGKLAAVWDGIRDKAVDVFHAITAPIQHVIDLVQSLLDKISSIHLPHIPGNPFDRLGGTTSGTGTSTSSDTVNLTLNVQVGPGTSSAQAGQTAQAMMDAIDDRLRLVGRKPVFTR